MFLLREKVDACFKHWNTRNYAWNPEKIRTHLLEKGSKAKQDDILQSSSSKSANTTTFKPCSWCTTTTTLESPFRPTIEFSACHKYWEKGVHNKPEFDYKEICDTIKPEPEFSQTKICDHTYLKTNAADVDEFLFPILCKDFFDFAQGMISITLASALVNMRTRGLYALITAIENSGNTYTAIVNEKDFILLALNVSRMIRIKFTWKSSMLSVAETCRSMMKCKEFTRKLLSVRPGATLIETTLYTAGQAYFELDVLCQTIAEAEDLYDFLNPGPYGPSTFTDVTDGVILDSLWKNVGPTKPTMPGGEELDVEELRGALLRKTRPEEGKTERGQIANFTQQEWARFGIANLRKNHYVKVDSDYFTPAFVKFASVTATRVEHDMFDWYECISSTDRVVPNPRTRNQSDEEMEASANSRLSARSSAPARPKRLLPAKIRSGTICGSPGTVPIQTLQRASELMGERGFSGFFIYSSFGNQSSPECYPKTQVEIVQLPLWLQRLQEKSGFFRAAFGVNFSMHPDLRKSFYKTGRVRKFPNVGSLSRVVRKGCLLLFKSNHDTLGHQAKIGPERDFNVIPHTIGNGNVIGTGYGGIEFQFPEIFHVPERGRPRRKRQKEEEEEATVNAGEEEARAAAAAAAAEQQQQQQQEKGQEQEQVQAGGAGDGLGEVRPCSGTLYAAGLKRIMYKHFGNSLLKKGGIHPSSVRDQRLPKIRENFARLATAVQSTQGAHRWLQISRVEFTFAGWTLKEASSNAEVFCNKHGVSGFFDTTEDAKSSEAGQLSREAKLLHLLERHGVDTYAIPIDQMMYGLKDSLYRFSDMVSKFCSIQNRNPKETKEKQTKSRQQEQVMVEKKTKSLTPEQDQVFLELWVGFLAEFGMRRTYFDGRNSNTIITEPAAHFKMVNNLIEHAAWVSGPFQHHCGTQGIGIGLVERLESREKKLLHQQIGISAGENWGVCPKCGESFDKVIGLDHQNKRIRESHHIFNCEGKKMEIVKQARFQTINDETLQQIALLLRENVYVILALNVQDLASSRRSRATGFHGNVGIQWNRVPQPPVGGKEIKNISLLLLLSSRCQPSTPSPPPKIELTQPEWEGISIHNCSEKDFIKVMNWCYIPVGFDLLTISDKFHSDDIIVVPAIEDGKESVELKASKSRGADGTFAKRENIQELPMRPRPAEASDAACKKRLNQNDDPDYGQEKTKMSGSGRNDGVRMFPNAVSAVCHVVYSARKAWKKSNRICDLEEAWDWRYSP